jgi:drug/metabolite transporter (DMT)-like permease
MSPTGVAFSYAIGLIFAVGGILFLALLDENRLLFGIPYLLMGLVILGGVAASQRRLRRRAQGDEARGRDPGSGRPTPY